MSGLFRKASKFNHPPRTNDPVPVVVFPPPPFGPPPVQPAPEQNVGTSAEVPTERNTPLRAWPEGAHEFAPGAWYVPYKGAEGGPFKTPQEAVEWMRAVDERDGVLGRWEQEFGAVRYIGTSGIDAMALAENLDATLYLAGASKSYFGDLYRVVLSGKNVDISRCINNGEYRAGTPGLGIPPTLVTAVDAALAAQARGEAPTYRAV